MELKVIRRELGDKATIGDLFINDERFCFTLEDVVRPDGVKVFGETAIPEGTYTVIINHSQRFNRDMPLLVDVPQFDGIRIHSGNTDQDTHGCILVGQTRVNDDFIGESRVAFGLLFPQIEAAIKSGEGVTITITQETT